MVKSLKPEIPRRAILLTIGGAVLIIALGSVIAIVQTNTNLAALFQQLGESVVRFGGANLTTKIDRSELPADGRTQTVIEVSTYRVNDDNIKAKVVSGSGQIAPHPASPDNRFVYTAGSEAGPVVIAITAGTITDEITLNLIAPGEVKKTTLVAPPDASQTNDPRPEVAGTGPALSKVIITDNGNQNTVTRTNDQGVFKTLLDKPLYNGPHTLTATVVNELDTAIETSNPVNITVQTDPVKIDSDNIRTSPSRLIANSSFGLFIPVSRNTAKVIVELENVKYDLLDTHGSSVFSNILPTPPQAGVYFGNLVLYDTGGNETRFDKLLRLTVFSS